MYVDPLTDSIEVENGKSIECYQKKYSSSSFCLKFEFYKSQSYIFRFCFIYLLNFPILQFFN